MENNYIIPNSSPEQKLARAIIRVIRRISIAINNMLTSLEGNTGWVVEDNLYNPSEKLVILEDINSDQLIKNRPAKPDKSVLLNEAIQLHFPVLTNKRRKRQLDMDYLLAISG